MPAVLVAPVVAQGVVTAGLVAGGVLLKSFLDWEEVRDLLGGSV